MFRKILIANRGEIAVRILRACREMGIPTVAVYSDADRAASHVIFADEAVRIGPAPPTESYLRFDALLEAARRTGADAIHPGYGFLAENAAFAAACADAGVRFIGPSPEAISRMGDKLEARRGAEAFGVPVIPGTLGEALDPKSVRSQAEAIGFPVMLKAVGGGGGKGMRIVESADALEGAVSTAGSEARKAFGNGELYLEKCLDRARHVEVQIARAAGGRAVHLFERECSLQRRHQKLLEEAPAAIPPELRRRMTDAAVRIADGIEYETLGTVEFLVQGEEFYFLEMNTRLQVEHPVTEMICGIDLVKLQIRLAAGEPMGFDQADVTCRGHAVEARICAEDPYAGFRPVFGRVEDVRWPGGPGVRIDSDLRAGGEVTLFYDPLVAKVIVHAEERGAALDRLRFALSELRVAGLRTTAGLLARVAGDREFREEGYDTSFLEAFLAREEREPTAAADDLAAAAALVHDRVRSERRVPTSDEGAKAAAESTWVARARIDATRGRMP